MVSKSDKIGELWSELQKSEERLRTVGGGIPAPTLDCFINESPHDPFDATVFTALSDSDLRTRINNAQGSVAAMVAAVVADIDGKPNAQVSPMFTRGRAQLSPMGTIEGPHSQWASAKTDAAKSSQTPAQILADKAAKHGLAKTAPGQPAKPDKKKPTTKSRLWSSSQALNTGALDTADDFTAPEVSAEKFEHLPVPEPRSDRDSSDALHVNKAEAVKKIKKKKPLWLKILWG